MGKTDSGRNVVRDYKGLYDTDELIRRIVRHHLGGNWGGSKTSAVPARKADGHAAEYKE